MGRGPIPRRPRGGFPTSYLCTSPLIRHYHMFPCAIRDQGAGCPRVTHPSAASVPAEAGPFARLACLRRAASVRSEPGSNSPSLIRSPKEALFNHYVLSCRSPTKPASISLPFVLELTEASKLLFSLSSPSLQMLKIASRLSRGHDSLLRLSISCQALSPADL